MWLPGPYVWALFFIWVTHSIYRWCNPKCSTGKLPPGSMGLPLLGETHHFFAPNVTLDVSPFVKERVERCGPIFKTSLVGRPIVVSADADFNCFLFQQEGKLFESWYPDTFTEIFGRQNVGSLHGSMYRYLKNLILNLFGPENLKEKLLPEIETVAHRSLESWCALPSVELKDATADLIFELAAEKLISYSPSEDLKTLRKNFSAFIAGLISFPLRIPGTAYYKCLQGRRKVMKMLKNMMHERLAEPKRVHGDFFDILVEEVKKEKPVVTEAMALDLMFVLLFASFETTSLALTLGVRLLTENPEVVEKLREEHDAILRNRETKACGITWKEYKSMAYTYQVINEMVRLANIVPGVFRKALQDIKVKGYTIPKGWGVVACPPAVHLNPSIFPDPLSFNPSRWESSDLDSKNFMAFGGGMRLCVGADFARIQMAVFLHCLVTRFSWKVVRGGETVRTPGLAFPNGFHIQLYERKGKVSDHSISPD
ncbi:cytochrome P450 87A3 [Nymphaea colorata]|nr:cytochrome P450 87A3 [Nymphaea colorata]